jgi:hypothetical protein
MNRKIIIFISCIAYVVAMISMFILVEEFIDTKKNRLYREMVDLFEHLFDGETTLLDEAYSEKMVVWENYPIPSTNNSFPSSVWENGKLSFKYEPDPFLEDLYGDLSSLVKLNKNSDFYSHDYEADIKQAKKALSLLEANKKKLSHNEYVRKHKDVTIKIKTLEETRKKQKNALKKEFLTIYYPDNDTSRIAKNSRGCDGWSFISLYYNQWEHRIYISWLCPYAIGFKRNIPQNTLGDAIGNVMNKAYASLMNSDDFLKGSFYNIYGERFYQNEYYYIAIEEKDSIYSGSLFPLDFVDYREGEPYVHSTIIQNNDSKLFLSKSQPLTLTITMRENIDKKEKIICCIIYSLVLTSLLLIGIKCIRIREKKMKQLETESLYQILLRTCHPSNFIKNYDKEKLDLANELYSRLNVTDSNDLNSLYNIEKIVLTKLGVKTIDAKLIKKLQKDVAPKQFISPYNPEKLELANDLYNRLLKDDLTYSEYIDIKEKACELKNN